MQEYLNDGFEPGHALAACLSLRNPDEGFEDELMLVASFNIMRYTINVDESRRELNKDYYIVWVNKELYDISADSIEELY